MSDYKRKKLWVICDVEENAKDQAKKLAKLEKKNIGVWLSSLILNKKHPSIYDSTAQLDNPRDVRKIINYLDNIKMEIRDIHIELATLATKVYPMQKKTFFDKFLK